VSYLVDTSVWSLFLRRTFSQLSLEERALVFELRDVIVRGEALLAADVIQECLSGLKSEQIYESLRRQLRYQHVVPTLLEDHEEAARLCNMLNGHGVASSHVDVLLCAIALRRNATIFTTDPDFVRYAQHLPIKIHPAPNASGAA
jgi:predicted nucleic acid-binding protein